MKLEMASLEKLLVGIDGRWDLNMGIPIESDCEVLVGPKGDCGGTICDAWLCS